MRRMKKAENLRNEFFPEWASLGAEAVYTIDSIIRAYADSHDDLDEERNLGFFASHPLNGDLAIEVAAKCIGSYNEFNSDQVRELVKIFGVDSRYFFAREGSPAIYIEPKKRVWLTEERRFFADEVSYEPSLGFFRIWWD